MSNTSYIQYGGDLMLFASTGSTTVQPLAFSSSAKLSISTKTRDVSTKDSGYWTEKLPGRMDWNVSSEALVNYTTTGTTQSTNELYTYMVERKSVNIAFASKTGTSPSWTVDSGVKKFTGIAYITSIELNASDGDNATYSISMEGSGALTLA